MEVPLFTDDTGISAELHIMPDLLHVCYLGVYSSYVGLVIWDALDSNVWNSTGKSKRERDSANLECVWSDIRRWYGRTKVPSSERLQQLVMTMLGSSEHRDFKVKGGEAGRLVGWAADFSARMRAGLRHGAILEAAGSSLVVYMETLATSGMKLTVPQRRAALDACLRHITVLREGEFGVTPKYHMWVHLTLKSADSNPRWWTTWLGESLNSVLAAAARASHRMTWEQSIMTRVLLLAALRPDGCWVAF